MRPQTSRRGFNLVEATIVLGVVGLIIGGIWVAASAVTTTRRTEEINLAIPQLFSALQRFSEGGGPNWTQRASVGPIVASSISGITYNNQESSTWFKSSYGVVSVFWGGPAGIMDSPSPYDTVIGVTFYDLPKDVCLRVVNRLKAIMLSGGNTVLFASTGVGTWEGSIRVPGGINCSGVDEPCFGTDLCLDDLNDLNIVAPDQQ